MFLYFLIFFVISNSLWDLFNRSDYTMTETSTLIENWEYKDIRFKDLIDIGFPLPAFNFTYGVYYDVDKFNI